MVVTSLPLQWDGRALSLGPPVAEQVVRSIDGTGFVDDLTPGDTVGLHWDWMCDRLDHRKGENLRKYAARQLEITNRRLTHPGPARVLR